MLETKIIKRFPGFTLDVGFSAPGGGAPLALLGASGCGKSLTLQCVAGLIRPDEGYVRLNGRVLFDSARGIDLPPRKRGIGYLFQNYSLFPNMTVLQNIMCPIDAPRRERRERAMRLISAMRLEGEEHKRPAQMSGGQRQRAALARMLAPEPEAVLLDEPFSALDGYLRWGLELELQDTLRAFGGPSVFVSHSRDEAYRLCADICVLSDGKSEPQRGTKDLFRAPETLAASLISGCKNYSRAQPLKNGRVHALDWGAELSVGDALPPGMTHVGVRAHYVKPGEGENTLSCRVARVIDDVFGIIVMLETPGGVSGYSLLRMELGRDEWTALGSPERLLVQIAPSDVMPLK